MTASLTTARSDVDAPLMRYHGGKWRLAPEIIAHFPPHRLYVEPFGGGGSVLLRKPRSSVEIYNDIDGDVVNLFRVLREPSMREALADAIALTPYARAEFCGAYDPTENAVERARRMLARAYMGFGTDAGCGAPSGFRADTSDAAPARVWTEVPARVQAAAARLTGVIIENRDAVEIIAANAGFADALFYVDPPYVASACSSQAACKGYRSALTDARHIELLDCVQKVRGNVVLSGYPSPLYEAALGDWRRVELPVSAHRGAPRLEVLWLSPSIKARQLSLI